MSLENTQFEKNGGSVKAVNLTAHTLTNNQIEELYHVWMVNDILPLTHKLKEDMTLIKDPSDIFYVYKEITEFCEKNLDLGDLVIIQGQHDLTVELVYGLSDKYQTLYAFSERKSVENREGDKVVKKSVFKHIKFVPYTMNKRMK